MPEHRDSVDSFDDFFGVPYPLPKLDMIAIPEFASTLIYSFLTFLETDIL